MTADVARLREALEPRRDAMLQSLRALVEHESPSDAKPALDALAAILADRFEAVGCRVDRVANPSGGDHVIARWGDDPSTKPALILAHFDTVWPVGTLQKMPFRIDEAAGTASGPGVYDMKASLVIVENALWAIQSAGWEPSRPLTILATSDEEVGSPDSRALIEAEALKSAYVLVLEPPLPGGRLKTARKGVGRFDLTIQGRAAHAGVEPGKGVSALKELSHQILNIDRIAAPEVGTSLNVGLARGGSTVNTVPAFATAAIDVRVTNPSEAERVEAALSALEPVLEGATLAVTGGMNRPPMVRTPAVVLLYERVREVGRLLGLELGEGSTGGGSDGNFTAALGLPTIDGLGADGDGAHAPHEQIKIDSLVERAALLTAILVAMDFPDPRESQP